MINVPPPTRVAIGTVVVAGKPVEIFLSVEWARYFEQLNLRAASTSQNLNNFVTGAFMGLLSEGGEDGDSILGPPGEPGTPGAPGPALFLLQDDLAGDQMIPFVPDLSQKADLSGAAFTGPISAVGDFPTKHAVAAKSTAVGNPAMSATTNSDGSHFLVNYSGSSTDPAPAIFWTTGGALRFGVATNSVNAAGFTQLTSIGAAGLAVATGFGCNSKPPQAAAAVNTAATDLSTVITLCNQLRAALIANGIAA